MRPTLNSLRVNEHPVLRNRETLINERNYYSQFFIAKIFPRKGWKLEMRAVNRCQIWKG